MIINDKSLNMLIKKTKPLYHQDSDYIICILLENKNISSFTLKGKLCERLEFLSLQSNYIKDVTFLKNFSNLFYLDIRDNPIEDYEIFNEVNSFGYLGISASSEAYLEKKISVIRRINVGIIQLSLGEENKKTFILNNPNIIKLNDEILYFHERFKQVCEPLLHGNNTKENVQMYSRMKTSTIREYAALQKRISRCETSGAGFQRKLIHSVSSILERESKSSHVFVNDKVNQMKSFFDEYTCGISQILQNPSTFINGINEKILYENIDYIKLERRRLVMLSRLYEHVMNLKLNNDRVYNINQDTGTCSCKRPMLKTEMAKVKDHQLQIMLLTVYALFILHVINKEFAYEIFKHIFIHFATIKNENDIKIFLDIDLTFHMGIYFDLYDMYTQKETEKDFPKIPNDNKYEEILQYLDLAQLAPHCNLLKTHRKVASVLFSPENDFEMRKGLIEEHIIRFVDELNIFKQSLLFMQFLEDFLIFRKIEGVFIKEHTLLYRVFLEIREHMFNRTGQYVSIYSTLSDRKYTESKLRNLGNTLYLANNNQIKSDKKIQIPESSHAFEFFRRESISKMKQHKHASSQDNPNSYECAPLYYRKIHERRLLCKKLREKTSTRYLQASSTTVRDDLSSRQYPELDNLIMSSKIDLTKYTKPFIFDKSCAVKVNENGNNQLKSLLDDNTLKCHVKINLKNKNSNISKDMDSEPTKVNLKGFSFIEHSPRLLESITKSKDILKGKMKYTFVKQKKKQIHNKPEERLNYTHYPSPGTGQYLWQCFENPIKTEQRTKSSVYDFKLNLHRLTHRWNENYGKKNESTEKPQNIMSAEEICSLFSIEALDSKLHSKKEVIDCIKKIK